MGFTPLDGVLMGTRCGAVDPSAVTYVAGKHGLAHIVVGHCVKEVQLLGDLAQHLTAGLQVGAEQLLVDGGVHGLRSRP